MRKQSPNPMDHRLHRGLHHNLSPIAVTMRCVRDCHSVAPLNLHYLESVGVALNFAYMKEAFFLPFMYVVKALTDHSDRMIYQALVAGRERDDFWKDTVINMLRAAQQDGEPPF